MKLYDVNYLKEGLRQVFEKFPNVLLAYLYGSQVKRKIGRLSDLDIAVVWKDKKVNLREELLLEKEIKIKLKEEAIEVVSLNDCGLSFCYQVISHGILIYGKEEERIKYETNLLNEYLDFSWFAEEYNHAFMKKILRKDAK